MITEMNEGDTIDLDKKPLPQISRDDGCKGDTVDRALCMGFNGLIGNRCLRAKSHDVGNIFDPFLPLPNHRIEMITVLMRRDDCYLLVLEFIGINPSIEY
jgi:hypothetical protein